MSVVCHSLLLLSEILSDKRFLNAFCNEHFVFPRMAVCVSMYFSASIFPDFINRKAIYIPSRSPALIISVFLESGSVVSTCLEDIKKMPAEPGGASVAGYITEIPITKIIHLVKYSILFSPNQVLYSASQKTT